MFVHTILLRVSHLLSPFVLRLEPIPKRASTLVKTGTLTCAALSTAGACRKLKVLRRSLSSRARRGARYAAMGEAGGGCTLT